MIITVTLNAAIDKSLSVPNFRLGRRHRTVEQTTMPGGKGVNVARTLKSLGQPVIATGFAGGADGHAHRRAAHRGVDPQRLRAHPRGVAHQHRRARPHQRRDDGDQRARARRERQGDRALPRQAALPLARRRRGRLRGLAAARRRVRCLRAAHQGGAQVRRADRGRRRRRSDAPGRARRARRHLAQRDRGRGARRPRVQRRRGPHHRRARDGRPRRARGDHDAARRVRRLGDRGRRAGAAPRVDRAARGGGGRGRRRRVPGRVRGRPLHGLARRRTACASAWPAARSPPSASGRG